MSDIPPLDRKQELRPKIFWPPTSKEDSLGGLIPPAEQTMPNKLPAPHKRGTSWELHEQQIARRSTLILGRAWDSPLWPKDMEGAQRHREIPHCKEPGQESPWLPKPETPLLHPQTQKWTVGAIKGDPGPRYVVSSWPKKYSPSPTDGIILSLQGPVQENLFDLKSLTLPSTTERNVGSGQRNPCHLSGSISRAQWGPSSTR